MNTRSTIATLATLILGTTASLAGPLDPPAGPIAPSYKTLTEVEPRIAINSTNTPGFANSQYRISAPGSYYLTGNVTVPPGQFCIEVISDNVTIDLNGMTITGSPTSIGGIYTANIYNNLNIRNGTITSIGAGNAIGYSIATARGWRIENVTATNNGSEGIRVPVSSFVTRCRAASNGGVGIYAGETAQITDCISEMNSSHGVQVSNLSTVSRTTARNNGGDGIRAASDGTTVLDSMSWNNTGNGIAGLNAAHIAGCTVRSNGLVGIQASASAIIENNDVTFSGGHGITFFNNCIVRDNVSDQNGQTTAGAGIFTSSSRSRIEGNSCVSNDYGIRVTISSNFIARNVVGSSTTLNWDIALGNRCLVVQAASAPAISGNSGGASPGSTDPNANFTN